MYVFCVGMNRAASTWQYNVVSELLERHRGGRRLGFFPTGDAFAAHDRAHPAGGAWQSLKAHDGHPAYAAALAEGRALAVYSCRDLRDVAYSLMHKCSADFDEVVLRQRYLHTCLDNDRFWTARPRTLVQRYEDVVGDPAAGVGELARHLGVDLAAAEAEALAREHSLAANRGRAAALAGRLRAEGAGLEDPANALCRDEHTQLHWNHVRDGRVGAWRDRATPRELALLAGVCGGWLIERGYEPDYGWAAPALAELCQELGAAQRELREQALQREASRQRLAAVDGLGPVALGVARRVQRLASRCRRLSAAFRRLVRPNGRLAASLGRAR
jgi:hypothetical protein